MIGIYKITSPIGRVYIGQSVNIEKRIKQYKRMHCKTQPKVYNSFLLYGVDSHLFEIICECDISQLNKMERFWQDNFKTIGGMGLNCRVTGDKSGFLSEDHKRKVSLGLTGKPGTKHTFKSKEKLRLANLGRIKTEQERINISIAQKGKVFTKETREKIKTTHRNRKIKPSKEAIDLSIIKNSKPILDTLTGVYYNSVKELSDLIRVNYPSLLGKLNNSRRKNDTQYIQA